MRDLGAILILVVLVAAGCSSGISDEVMTAALEDARQANVRVGELETAVSVAEDQLVDVEGDLSQVQADKAGADALAESLRGDADALRDDAAELRGRDRFSSGAARLGERSDRGGSGPLW